MNDLAHPFRHSEMKLFFRETMRRAETEKVSNLLRALEAVEENVSAAGDGEIGSSAHELLGRQAHPGECVRLESDLLQGPLVHASIHEEDGEVRKEVASMVMFLVAGCRKVNGATGGICLRSCLDARCHVDQAIA